MAYSPLTSFPALLNSCWVMNHQRGPVTHPRLVREEPRPVRANSVSWRKHVRKGLNKWSVRSFASVVEDAYLAMTGRCDSFTVRHYHACDNSWENVSMCFFFVFALKLNPQYNFWARTVIWLSLCVANLTVQYCPLMEKGKQDCRLNVGECNMGFNQQSPNYKEQQIQQNRKTLEDSTMCM